MLKHAIRHYLIISQNIYYYKWSRFGVSSFNVSQLSNCSAYTFKALSLLSFNSF